MRSTALRVFDEGLVADLLAKGFASWLTSDGLASVDDSQHERLFEDGIACIRRLILRVQSYKHGGAILIAPAADSLDPRGLNIRYSMDYGRIPQSLCRIYAETPGAKDYGDLLFDALEAKAPNIPTAWWWIETASTDVINECQEELDGILWFLSLLSRVDGLLLFTPQLRAVGFGVLITEDKEPTTICEPKDVSAHECNDIDINRYGTRHQSMIRYCAANPGSIGFVVSQDGDVRVVTRHGPRLAVFEDVQVGRTFSL